MPCKATVTSRPSRRMWIVSPSTTRVTAQEALVGFLGLRWWTQCQSQRRRQHGRSGSICTCEGVESGDAPCRSGVVSGTMDPVSRSSNRAGQNCHRN
jgi:hypothetical protein